MVKKLQKIAKPTEWYGKTVVMTLKEVTVNLTAVALMDSTLMLMMSVLLKMLVMKLLSK
jgi:hypothetical protein